MTVSIVEFGAGNGHQSHYLSLIAEAWRAHSSGELLTISLRRNLLDSHPELASLAARDVEVVPLPAEADAVVEECLSNADVSMASVLPGARANPAVADLWNAANDEAERLRARHLFLTELDRCLPALAGGMTGACPVSGIWFKPRFHYSDLHWQGAPPGAFSTAERWMLARALANPHLRSLLVLDPFAAEKLAAAPAGAKVAWLADPLAAYPAADRAEARAKLALGDRWTVLHFGEVGSRKGVANLVQACALLEPAVARRLALVVAGPRTDISENALAQLLEKARDAGCSITMFPGFVGEETAGQLFAAADVVSVAYANHAGMSGVLLSAAAHGRPVMAQSQGLIAALVARHRLGVVLPAGDPETIAMALSRMIDTASVDGFEPRSADAFARLHDRVYFQREIARALSLPD